MDPVHHRRQQLLLCVPLCFDTAGASSGAAAAAAPAAADADAPARLPMVLLLLGRRRVAQLDVHRRIQWHAAGLACTLVYAARREPGCAGAQQARLPTPCVRATSARRGVSAGECPFVCTVGRRRCGHVAWDLARAPMISARCVSFNLRSELRALTLLPLLRALTLLVLMHPTDLKLLHAQACAACADPARMNAPYAPEAVTCASLCCVR
eukprot:366217-Chlamydomonas_euryale.AAC.26